MNTIYMSALLPSWLCQIVPHDTLYSFRYVIASRGWSSLTLGMVCPKDAYYVIFAPHGAFGR